MSSLISTTAFTISNFQAGGAGIFCQVKPQYVISGYRVLAENESGGTANLTIQFSQGDSSAPRPLGQPVHMAIGTSVPPGVTIVAPEKATFASINFGDVSFPTGTVLLSVSTGD